jgi:pantoate--beta-alanine ligase
MGALHDGHVALVRRAAATCDRVVVSIFVNPTQFGPGEDFTAYPRREAEDLARLAEAGASLAWLPAVEDMYPPGFSTVVSVKELTETLEGTHRPVAGVVTKLLLQVLPDTAYFGEKDYQQLQVIRRLVRDLDIPVRVEAVETVRDADGLALSSRNLYLTPDERRRAVALPRTLQATAAAARARPEGPFDDLLASARTALETSGFGPVDYVAICDAETLRPARDLRRPARILAAVRLGRTRLIDNLIIPG